MLLKVKANTGAQSSIPVIVTDKTRLYVEQEDDSIKVIAEDRAGQTTGEIKAPDITMSASIDEAYSETPYVEITKSVEEGGVINFNLNFKGITPNKSYVDKVIEDLIGGASENYNTLGKIEVELEDKASMQALSAEILRATTTENLLQQQIDVITSQGSEEAATDLIEAGIIQPVVDESNNIMVDANDTIYI